MDRVWARTFAHVPASSVRLPMFPLGTVLFPGQSVPLHVFEDRYRALVHDLMAVEDPADRLFATVAIREGYEVGDHGAQSLYRVGCTVQLTEVEENPDGSFEVVGVCRGRMRLDSLGTLGAYATADVVLLDDGEVPVPDQVADAARARFTAYRDAVSQWHDEAFVGTLPRDPHYLAWTLAALTPLPLSERQSLLEADDTVERLRLVTAHLRDELRVMGAVPSLPAVEVARTRWSPN